MKPWIKVLIGVVSGFAGGFAAGFLFHKKLNDIQFDEIDEEEMSKIENSVKENAESKEETIDILSGVSKVIENADPQNEDELRNALEGKVSYIKADAEAKKRFASTWETIKDYSSEENADSMPVNVEENFDEDFLEMFELEEVEPGQVTPPHIISFNEFYNERPEYDKITIEWYEDDNTLVDENGEFIIDAVPYIGQSSVGDLFKESTNDEDPDVRFIRNEQYGSDYEIVRYHRSYKETVGEEE